MFIVLATATKGGRQGDVWSDRVEAEEGGNIKKGEEGKKTVRWSQQLVKVKKDAEEVGNITAINIMTDDGGWPGKIPTR